jgi:hypothetical protein
VVDGSVGVLCPVSVASASLAVRTTASTSISASPVSRQKEQYNHYHMKLLSSFSLILSAVKSHSYRLNSSEIPWPGPALGSPGFSPKLFSGRAPPDPRVKSGAPNLQPVTSPGTRQQPPESTNLDTMLLGLSIASCTHSNPDLPTGGL